MSWDMRLKNPQKKAEPMICDGCFHNTVCRLDGNEMLEWCSARAPSADVVEVIRCKDCKYFIKFAEDYISVEDADGMCDFYDCGMKRLDFCSYGERGDENAEI